MCRPWLDDRIDAFLGGWYFPLSRAWAAAIEADGSLEKFAESLPFTRRPPMLQDSLRRIARLRLLYDQAEAAWGDAFFGGADRDLAAVQRERRERALAFMGGRACLVPLRTLNRLPAIRWEIASEEEVEAAHGGRLAAPEHAFLLSPAPAPVEESRPIPVGGHREYWLRFPSPVPRADGNAWAHVFEPEDVEDPPTLIFMHGIAVEPEFVPDPRDAIVRLAERGIRVVMPEAPWHGRRRAPGYFGGERVLATAPLGFLDFFHAAAMEVAELIRWARPRTTGAIGVGGYSLGSLTSALVAEVSGSWPEEARPEALLLVAYGADPARVALEGSLMQRIGFDAALHASGWDLDRFERWMPLVAPTTSPAIDPARIVAVLGEADSLTHCDEALIRLRRWRVPEANIFNPRRGHYTIAPALAFDCEPLDRFVGLLNQDRGRVAR